MLFDDTFFDYIVNWYGKSTKQKMKEFLKKNKQMASHRSRKEFLLQCRRFKVTPKSLQINMKRFTHCINQRSIAELTVKFSNELLNAAIKKQFIDIDSTKKALSTASKEISNLVPADVFTNFKQHVRSSFDTELKKRTKAQKLRFEKLIEPMKQHLVMDNNTSKWINNLTNLEIPKNVMNILQLDGKFNLPTEQKKLPVVDIVANLEPTIQELEPELRMATRNKLCNTLMNFKNGPKRFTAFEKLIKNQFIETKQFLRSHPDILVTSADKGNVTVLMSKLDYDAKMKVLLDERTTYTVLDEDPTKRIEGRCNRLILKWKRMGFVTEEEASKLTRYNSICSRMYGKPKIHKPNAPLRPIVSMVDSATYNLSKMFATTLKNVTGKTNRSVKNAFELKNALKNLKIPKGYILISLDVVSLFTKIPKELVYQCIRDKWDTIEPFTNLPMNEFLNGLELVMDNCVFQHKEIIYQQIFGSPMGSPGSPSFADLVMETLEETVIKKLPFKLPFYFRYVDDIITAVPKNKVEDTRAIFNSFNENIQFTVEIENNNQIAFLDIWVIRTVTGTIKTDWYHKETWSGRYLHYYSHLPFTYKRNTIKILADKIIKLADVEFHKKNFDLLAKVLIENNYPKKLIWNTIRSSLESSVENSETEKEKEEKRYVAIPYVKGLFEKIAPIFKNTNTRIVGRSSNNLQRTIFTRLKDEVPKMEKSHVVYNIPCSCDECYVGETRNRVATREVGHQYNIATKNKSHSALCKHVIESNPTHTPKWSDVEIIYQERNNRARQIKEMIAIKQTENNMNKKTDTLFLSTIYNEILGLQSHTEID